MDPRTFRRRLRCEGFIPFTVSAALIGLVVALWETGPAADRDLFIIAAVAAFRRVA